MPLESNGENRIRRNLMQVRDGRRPQRAIIGALTETQLAQINRYRHENGLPPIDAQIIFFGRHLYASRCVRDGYSIEEVIAQIRRALDVTAIFKPVRSWTVLENPDSRTDSEGHEIYDAVIFECTAHAPSPELFSVVPKGDGRHRK